MPLKIAVYFKYWKMVSWLFGGGSNGQIERLMMEGANRAPEGRELRHLTDEAR